MVRRINPHPFEVLTSTAIVLGNYLYIDGGEITFLDNGEPVHVPGSSSEHCRHISTILTALQIITLIR